MSMPPPPPPGSQPLPPPPPNPAAPAYANPVVRLGARIIDTILVRAVPSFVGWAIVGPRFGLLLGAIAMAAYDLLFVASRGQTLGKQWLGVKVVRPDGRPCDVDGATRRVVLPLVGDLLRVVVAFFGGLLLVVDAVWCLWDPRRQCLHDKIADTIVVTA